MAVEVYDPKLQVDGNYRSQFEGWRIDDVRPRINDPAGIDEPRALCPRCAEELDKFMQGYMVSKTYLRR